MYIVIETRSKRVRNTEYVEKGIPPEFYDTSENVVYYPVDDQELTDVILHIGHTKFKVFSGSEVKIRIETKISIV